jgi:hypothetical protein
MSADVMKLVILLMGCILIAGSFPIIVLEYFDAWWSLLK